MRKSIELMAMKLRVVSFLLMLGTIAAAQSSGPEQAISLEKEGKWAEAEQVWRSVVQQDPNDAAAFASLGVDLARQQKYEEATSSYRQALKLDPKLPGIELNLGLAEFKQGHFVAAATALKKTLASDPSNMQARTLLGMSYYGAKQFDRAAEYLEPVAKSDPANAELHQMLAQSCLWSKNFDCASEQFHVLLDQSPDSAPAHVLYGEALDGMGRTQEAIAEFDAAAKISPHEPNVHFGLGYLHWKSQQYDNARREFNLELESDPTHAQSLAYLGDIECKNDHPDAAIALLKRAQRVNDDLRIVYVDLGAIYLQQKDYKHAQTALERAVQLDPEQADAHYQLGRLYQAQGNSPAAEEELAKVRELHKKADDLAGKMAAAPPAMDSHDKR
jgi:tetratricopeptide (TPR) repeat protein